MDKEHKKRKGKYRAQESDMLGSARMVTLKGQPHLDQYVEMTEEENKSKKRDK
jgi:hypothetical protein